MDPHIEAAIRACGARIVVTGAGGWIGLATLELLSSALGSAFAARVQCFGASRRVLTLQDGTRIEQRPLVEIGKLAAEPTIVLHLAFLTKERAEAMDEAAYCEANRQLYRAVLAALDGLGAIAVFVASSGAAAVAGDAEATASMRLYGSLKREQEDAFANWAEQRRKRAVIARIFNLSGPHINKHSSYALASFILDALAGRPIAIQARHRVVRSYVAIRELMALAFALLLDGGSGVTRFDSGGEPMEMQDIAQAVADALGPVGIDRPATDGGTEDRYAGNGEAYAALLAAHGIEPVPFERQVIETADFLALSQGLS
jgi:UDP-glucuronate decarboxylase